MTSFKQLKNLLIYGWNVAPGTKHFCKDTKIEMVADAKRRRSGFIMYVKESLNVSSSMF